MPRSRWKSLRFRVATILLCLTPVPVFGEPEGHFDCVDAFELTGLATTLGCPESANPPIAEPQIDVAVDVLVNAGFFTRAEFERIDIQWCALTSAMGFVPNQGQVFIDDGLQLGTIDLLAEVLAHEMIHVRQFGKLGERGFKCEYVNAYIRCGACQDRGHALEREAYEFQDDVREYLLGRWKKTATIPSIVEPASGFVDPH